MLFDIPTKPKAQTTSTSGSKIKLKKGQTVTDLVLQAKQIVEEKLVKYKDVSKAITNVNDLYMFFTQIPDNSVIGIDTETTG